MNQKKINIASINKTFLRPKQKITIPGYYIVRKDLPSGHGWGVIIFVRDDIPSNTFEVDANNILDKKSNSFIMLNTLVWVQRKPMIAKLN